MRRGRGLEQHIAVFGGSGSGKTVLLSSFYGSMVDADQAGDRQFDLIADDLADGVRLLNNYLGMRDDGRRPEPTRFAHTSYGFSLQLKNPGSKARGARPVETVRLVWHDYPGEWFEQEVSGPDEEQRRITAFRSLLSSDVAVLLVDGQKLVDHAGEEGVYLKSLFTTFRQGLLRLKGDLLGDAPAFRQFPRIWILGLSKADLLPELDVAGFRDLVVKTAPEDLLDFRRVLQDILVAPDALAFGEDFLLLSSARFEPNRIRVTERIGVDLVLPIAAVLPFQRHIRWVERKQIPVGMAAGLVESAGALALAILGKSGRAAAVLKRVEGLVGRPGVDAAMQGAGQLAAEQLRKLNTDARQKQDLMQEILTGFMLDLDEGEAKKVLLRSKR